MSFIPRRTESRRRSQSHASISVISIVTLSGMPSAKTRVVVTAASGAVLIPQQKRFNTLIRQIEKARQSLTLWQDKLVSFRHDWIDDVVPLEKELQALQSEWLFELDTVFTNGKLTKTERNTLSRLIASETFGLLHVSQGDEGLRALFDKHSDTDFESQQQEMMLVVKEMAEAMSGLDLGDDAGIRSEADLYARMQEKMGEHAAAEASARKAQAERPRKKTEAQQRREAEVQQATQSVREVFRKLAAALHPDRESDPEQREAKTLLMARVNQAYAANDLLTLLELQLQIEQIDAEHIANTSAERLKYYNKVLAGQLAEIKQEIDDLTRAFCIEFNAAPLGKPDPRSLGELVEQKCAELMDQLAQYQRNRRLLANPAALKEWLKHERQEQRKDDGAFFDAMPAW